MIRTVFLAVLLAVACAVGEIQPAHPDASAACAGCRMTVTDLRFAGQLVARGEEPRFFDDIGCMRKYRAAHANVQWRGYVSDFQTRTWLRSEAAQYWSCGSIDTPMNSHLVAVAMNAEKPASDCAALSATDVFGK